MEISNARCLSNNETSFLRMVMKHVHGIINWDHRNNFNAIKLRRETWKFSTKLLMKTVKLTIYSALHILQTSKMPLLKDMSIKSKSWWNFIVNRQRRKKKIESFKSHFPQAWFSLRLSLLRFHSKFSDDFVWFDLCKYNFHSCWDCLRYWWDFLRREQSEKTSSRFH